MTFKERLRAGGSHASPIQGLDVACHVPLTTPSAHNQATSPPAARLPSGHAVTELSVFMVRISGWCFLSHPVLFPWCPGPTSHFSQNVLTYSFSISHVFPKSQVRTCPAASVRDC